MTDGSAGTGFEACAGCDVGAGILPLRMGAISGSFVSSRGGGEKTAPTTGVEDVEGVGRDDSFGTVLGPEYICKVC